MGAWGTGSFENDSAGDMLAEYAAAGVSVIEQYLMEASEFDPSAYMESYLGAGAIAAAEVVAFAHGHGLVGLPASIVERINLHGEDVRENRQLVDYAKAIFGPVMNHDQSEHFQLWAEVPGADFEQFKANVADLRARLEAIG